MTLRREVAMIQDYSGLLIKSEEQTQFILQVIAQHRKLFQDSKEMTVLRGLSASTSLPSAERLVSCLQALSALV